MIAKLLMAITVALTALGTPGATSDVFQVGDHYLQVEDDGQLTLWEESNGFPGLQSTPTLILGIVVGAPDHRVQL
jgi:hypothetical protein